MTKENIMTNDNKKFCLPHSVTTSLPLLSLSPPPLAYLSPSVPLHPYSNYQPDFSFCWQNVEYLLFFISNLSLMTWNIYIMTKRNFLVYWGKESVRNKPEIWRKLTERLILAS